MRELSMIRGVITGLLALLLSACAIQLVPEYDAALVTGLNAANEETAILFSELEEGSPQSEYALYRPRYARLIGKFTTLRQQAAARPVPELAKKLAKSRAFRAVCPDPPNAETCLNVTPDSIDAILRNLRRARERHRDQGLVAGAVESYNQAIALALAETLTVENALRR